jgi:hypothetical protein
LSFYFDAKNKAHQLYSKAENKMQQKSPQRAFLGGDMPI